MPHFYMLSIRKITNLNLSVYRTPILTYNILYSHVFENFVMHYKRAMCEWSLNTKLSHASKENMTFPPPYSLVKASWPKM